ncbi:hypothetical protein [Thioclava sp. DLFJ4-1]|uniref:hypothetical protein n=1 Tax=Thioclava sp. DLFJ4-1 TaxID=1915313 RepID=UPI001FEFCE63|nr:hypothetical protein [Thioclava sp. DLFJ4-1]
MKLAATRTFKLSFCQRAVEYHARHGDTSRRRTVRLTDASPVGLEVVKRDGALPNRDGRPRPASFPMHVSLIYH